MTNFLYTDDGNHQMWIPAHQGGSYSRVSRTQRFFVGSDAVYAAIGGDNFRQDSHVAFNNAFSIGQQIRGIDDTTATTVSTIGIVEDEVAGYGRYYFLEYEYNGAKQVPSAVRVYDSSYADEVAAAAVSDAWIPLVSLWDFVEQSMRVVNLGENGTWLFYVTPLPARKTRVHAVQLPAYGDPGHSDSPLSILDLEYEVLDRIYVVGFEDGRVFLYFGDTDRTRVRRTDVVGFNVATSSIFLERTTLVTDKAPFPRSYAACVGRTQFSETPIHMVLESARSWIESAGGSIDDDPNVVNSIAPLYRRSTGNAWTITSIGPSGKDIVDSVQVDGDTMRPWMGAVHADSQGGRNRVAVIPRLLQRIAPPPESYASFSSSGDFDVSDTYVLHAQANVRQEGVLQKTAFVYRKDAVSAMQPTFGNNRSTSNVYDESPPAPPEGSYTRRQLTPLLVPGTVLIESLRSSLTGAFPPLRTTSGVANRHKSWSLQDNSEIYGFPVASFGTPAIECTNHDPSTDCIHGVQGDFFDPDLAVIVGWFTSGNIPGGGGPV